MNQQLDAGPFTTRDFCLGLVLSTPFWVPLVGVIAFGLLHLGQISSDVLGVTGLELFHIDLSGD